MTKTEGLSDRPWLASSRQGYIPMLKCLEPCQRASERACAAVLWGSHAKAPRMPWRGDSGFGGQCIASIWTCKLSCPHGIPLGAVVPASETPGNGLWC